MTIEYCNDCVNERDPRYIDGVGCILGEIYGYCEFEECGGDCEPLGPCECICHAGDES